jgi:hypothetical protein
MNGESNMRRSASEIINELESRVARLERQASLSSNRLVKNISFIVKDKGRPNGTDGWNWFLTTNKGDKISLYYQDRMGTEVEIQNPPKSMLPYTGRPDGWGIAYISIADLSYFF